MPHKLLLADDSVTIQRVIELTFADEDIQVIAVGDGKKAIASLQADRPDIVLADVGMPERDGYEVASFVKSNPELAHIPVLLLTGAFEPVDEARARAVGCDGVLVKPFEPQMVINRVRDLLAGRKAGAAWNGATPAAGSPAAAAPQAPAPAGGAQSGTLDDYFDRLDAAFASMEGPGGPAADPPLAAPPSLGPAPEVPPARERPVETRRVAVTPAAEPLGALMPQATPAPQAAPLPQGIGEWDPDLTGDPHRPAPLEPPPIDLDPARGFLPSAPGRIPVSAPARMPPVAPPSAGQDAAASASASPVPAPPPAPAPAPLPPAPTLAEAFAALLSAEDGRAHTPSRISAVSDAEIDEIVQRVIVRMGDRAVRETVVDIAERLVREEIARIKGTGAAARPDR